MHLDWVSFCVDHCLTFFSFFGMYSTRSRVIPNIYVVLSRLARNYKKTGISFCFVYHLNFICPAFWVKLGETSYYPLQASAAQLYLPTECALFLIAKTMTTKAAREAPRRGEEGRRRTVVLPPLRRSFRRRRRRRPRGQRRLLVGPPPPADVVDVHAGGVLTDGRAR